MDRVSVIVRSRGTSSQLIPHPESGGIELHGLGGGGASGIFSFDAVLPLDISQSELYDGHLRRLLEDALENQMPLSVLAYGQTGAGKTYTMGTEPVEYETNRGIMPRAIEQIFRDPSKDFEVRASFFEIYNEQIFDLLTPERVPLTLKEDSSSHHFNIPSLSSVSVTSLHEALTALRTGGENRSRASTGQNNASSRSHAVFSLSLRAPGSTRDEPFTINMVDLAGSECLKRTNATGRTLVEGLNINKSLLALGNVVEALCSKKNHVPFRDSALTKILKECLSSAGSYTLMIACISHLDADLGDSANTLRYAQRAKGIRKQSIPSHKRKYPLVTPRKTYNPQYPFKTPGTVRNVSRTGWLTSTAVKGGPRDADLSHNISDASFLSNVSECCGGGGMSPRLRRYKEEIEQSILSNIHPLLKEIQDLKRQLNGGGRSKMKEAPISSHILPSSSSSSEDDDEVTIKAAGLVDISNVRRSNENRRPRGGSILRDRTNELMMTKTIPALVKPLELPEEKDMDLSLSLIEKKLGLHPDSPLLFDDDDLKKINRKVDDTLQCIRKSLGNLSTNVSPNKGRRQSVRIANRREERRGNTEKHTHVTTAPSQRRRSIRIMNIRESTLPDAPGHLHPMHVQKNWSVQSQRTHNQNVLGILNSGNLKVLQALPAIGPKSAMVIHTHRNLNGPLSSLTQLESIKGLAKSFYKKFLMQNQIVL